MLDLCMVIKSHHSVLSAMQQENRGQDDWIINTQLLRQLSHTLPLELRVIIWYQEGQDSTQVLLCVASHLVQS